MPGMFSCKMEMEAWRKSMRLFASQVMPNAVANALNRTADLVKAAAVHNLKQDFTVRTSFTTNSVRMSPAKPHADLRGYAVVGTVSKYLPIQDKGGTRKTPEIPTITGARAGSKGTIVPSRYRMKQLHAAIGPQTSKRRTRGPQPFMLTLRRGPGIFVRIGKELIMVRDLSKQSARIKGTHWFTRAVNQVGSFAAMHATFMKELRIQLQRIGK